MAFRSAIDSFKSGYYEAQNRPRPTKSDHWTTKLETTFNSPPAPGFVYQDALEPGNVDRVRVFELLPGEPDDPIHSKLASVPLGAETTYEALSYAWGSPANPQPIFIDGRVLEVTQSLRSALRHLRSRTRSRTLWIDAVCINQKSTDEKNYQVGLMSQIYRRSSKTLIWVGPASSESQTALKRCDILSRAAKGGSDNPINSIKWSAAEARIAQGVLSSDSGPTWNAPILSLLRCRWFSRAWVVQEAFLSSSAELHCGLASIDWSEFKQAIHYGFEKNLMLSHTDSAMYLNRMVDSHHFIPTRRTGVDNNPAGLLLKYLMDFRNREATKPSDKIYSLLGLVDSMDPIGIRVNYHLSTEQVYHEATVKILTFVDHLDILGAAGLAQDGRRPLHASWVAHWTSESLIAEALAHYSPHATQATLASTTHATFASTNSILILSGHGIGQIDAVSAVLPRHSYSTSNEYDFIGDSLDGWNSELSISAAAKGIGTSYNIMTDGLVQTTSTLCAWEKFAGIDKSNISSRPDYWQVLCTEHYLDEDEAATKREYLAWYDILNAQRSLSKVPLIGKTRLAAVVAHTKAVWSRSSRFPELLRFAYGRRLARVGEKLALVPQHAAVGDKVLLCQGGRVPLVARESSDGAGELVLLGEAYVNGIMQGQAFREADCQEIRFR